MGRESEIFTQYGANVVHLNALLRSSFRRVAPRGETETCLAADANSAGSLGLVGRAETAVTDYLLR